MGLNFIALELAAQLSLLDPFPFQSTPRGEAKAESNPLTGLGREDAGLLQHSPGDFSFVEQTSPTHTFLILLPNYQHSRMLNTIQHDCLWFLPFFIKNGKSVRVGGQNEHS